MRFGSLFAGIGGIDLGLERAGMGCAWQVEIDPFCRKVLAKHWPDVPKFEDVREVGAHNLPPVDVIAGGFPCQDISLAGKGAGLEGERSGLWWEYHRIIREMGPRYVIVENVRALTVRGLDAVLGSLADIGFDAEWQMLSAESVGAPHRRDRIFIVAYHGGERREGIWARPISRQPEFSWCEDVRRAEDFFGLSDIPEPLLRRIGDGIPPVVDRLRGLGNAVVPQVAEFVGRLIMEHHAQEAH